MKLASSAILCKRLNLSGTKMSACAIHVCLRRTHVSRSWVLMALRSALNVESDSGNTSVEDDMRGSMSSRVDCVRLS